MATTLVIACPDCGKQVRVSDEHLGKKIKCKECGTVFPIQAEGGSSSGKPPSKPKPSAKPAAPPPPIPLAKNKGDDDEDEDEDGRATAYGLIQTNDTAPRCPFCAKEMSSGDARICLNCGYDTQTRKRPEVKAVYAHTFMDRLIWLSPGLACFAIVIAFIVWDIIFFSLIPEWLKGSIFEDKEGEYIAGFHPGFFKLYMTLLLIFLSVPLVRIGYKRCFVNPTPPDKKIADDDD
jgi:predicted Zn finger-like uncharacterized protein